MCYDYTTVSFIFSYQRFMYKYFERIKLIENTALSRETFSVDSSTYTKYSLNGDHVIKKWLKEDAQDTLHTFVGNPPTLPAIKIGEYEMWLGDDGKPHRFGGPAITTDTYISYFVNGKCHKEDGPAYIQLYSESKNISYSWIYNGNNVTSEVTRYAKKNGIVLANMNDEDIMMVKLYLLQKG